MSFFAQKHTKITAFHLVSPHPEDMTEKLLFHSKWKKAVLVVPLLVTEFTKRENRPVFENIVKHPPKVLPPGVAWFPSHVCPKLGLDAV